MKYTPQPQRIEDPARTLATLIVANTVSGCITQPSYNEGAFVVRYACNAAIGNIVLRPAQVASIEILYSEPWYRVRVRHKGGLDQFYWDSKSIDDAQHIVDAIARMTAEATAPAPAPAAPAAPANTTAML